MCAGHGIGRELLHPMGHAAAEPAAGSLLSSSTREHGIPQWLVATGEPDFQWGAPAAREDGPGPVGRRDEPELRSQEARVWVRLLGAFQILVNLEPVRIDRPHKVAHLLGRLAMAGALGARRGKLLGALWPETDEDLAGQSLNATVCALSRALARPFRGQRPVIVDAGIYRLNPAAPMDIDALCFHAMCRSAAAAAATGDDGTAGRCFEKAAGLYRGDLCEGIPDPELMLEQDCLLLEYLKALEWLSHYYLSGGQVESCLQTVQRLLAKDPCNEEGHRLAMRCYLLSGRRSLALRQFLLCSELLRRHHGAEPEVETVALYQRILHNHLPL